MSLLETFYILIQSDASDVEKGAKKARKATKKLTDSLTEADQKAEKVGDSLMKVAKEFGGLITSALTVGSIIAGIKSAADYAHALKVAADYTGANVEALDAWGIAVEKSGGSAYYFQYTVKTLNQALQDAAKTGTGDAIEALNTLGISLRDSTGKTKDFTALLPELATAFEGLDKTTSTTLGEKLGLDWGTIMLLQKGRVEVDAMIARQKELGVVTKEDAEIASKFKEQWGDTMHAFRSMFLSVASLVLPALTNLGKAFENVAIFFRKHAGFIEGALLVISGAILSYVVPALVRMAAASIAAFLPFYVAGAIIAGLAVAFGALYEDVTAFLNGQESLTGKMLERWPIIGEIVKGVIGTIQTAWEFIKTLFTDIQNVINTIMSFKDKVASWLGFGGSDAKMVIEEGKKVIELANSTPIAAQTSNSILANTNNRSMNTAVSTGPITINTQATDAEGISTALGSSMENQIRQALNNFDDGVLA